MRLQQAVEQCAEGIALADLEDRFYFVNSAHKEMFGYASDALIGAHWSKLYDAEEAEKIEKYIIPKIKQDGHWTGELRGLRNDGRKIDIHIVVSAIRDSENAPTGVLCNYRDITQRKIAEASTRQLQKLDAIGQLTGGVAHDFNNILALIQGNLEIARIRSNQDSVTEVIEAAIDATERGSRLSSQLLAFARQQPLLPVVTNIADLLRYQSTILQRLLGEAITLTVDTADNLLNCKIDPNQFENVILNLAINAQDAMPSGGRLRVSAENTSLPESLVEESGEPITGDFVCVSVADTGTGITPDVIGRIFEPFFTTKRPGNGTGLGLSVAHGFIKQSGGHIAVESELSEGTTVKIYLPGTTTTAMIDRQ